MCFLCSGYVGCVEDMLVCSGCVVFVEDILGV